MKTSIFPHYPITATGYPTAETIKSEGTQYTAEELADFEDPNEYCPPDSDRIRLMNIYSRRGNHTQPTATSTNVEDQIEMHYSTDLFVLLDHETAEYVATQIAEQANKFMNQNFFENLSPSEWQEHCEEYDYTMVDEPTTYEEAMEWTPCELDKIQIWTEPYSAYTTELIMDYWTQNR